jgi:hypothetical protein
MLKEKKVPNRQVQRTCSWIFEAVLLLLNEKQYDKITVSDITTKAGIARQTFYRNYKDKDEVIIQYFANIFISEFMTMESIENKNKQENILLTFNIKYMVKHHANLKKIMSAIGIENLFLERFTEWQEMLIKQGYKKLNKEMQLIYRYKLIYQITGILRIILDWFKNDMPKPVNDLVKLLNYLTVDTKTHYTDVPNIKIKIIEH